MLCRLRGGTGTCGLCTRAGHKYVCSSLLPLTPQQLELQLSEVVEEAAVLRRQVADAAAVAEQRSREKAAADKEWGRRLGGRDKELVGRIKELEKQLHSADERSEG